MPWATDSRAQAALSSMTASPAFLSASVSGFARRTDVLLALDPRAAPQPCGAPQHTYAARLHRCTSDFGAAIDTIIGALLAGQATLACRTASATDAATTSDPAAQHSASQHHARHSHLRRCFLSATSPPLSPQCAAFGRLPQSPPGPVLFTQRTGPRGARGDCTSCARPSGNW